MHLDEDALYGQVAPTKRIKLVLNPIPKQKSKKQNARTAAKKAKITLEPTAQQEIALIQLFPELQQQDTQRRKAQRGEWSPNKNNNARPHTQEQHNAKLQETQSACRKAGTAEQGKRKLRKPYATKIRDLLQKTMQEQQSKTHSVRNR